MASISLRNITKIYGSRAAVNNITLDAASGGFLALTGPAGSGKSTVLRIIAGLEDADCGEIYIDGKSVATADVRERDVALVTADFSVYKKNATVRENLAFGLKLRKVDPLEIETRVRETASLFDVTHLLDEKASALSAGELRRVALCRAAVRRPSIVLLDEPLKGLDDDERVRVMTQIIKLRETLDAAVVCAMQDDVAAMTLGTSVAVMKDGVIRQIDTPKGIYDEPADTFVAAFVGNPPMNLFKARARRLQSGAIEAKLGLGEVALTLPAARAKRVLDIAETECDVIVGIRAEHFHADRRIIEASPDTVIESRIRLVERDGGDSLLYIDVDGKNGFAVARVSASQSYASGDKVCLAADFNRMQLFDAQSGKNLMALPDTDFIDCKLIAENGGTVKARFGPNSFTLGGETVSRITDRTIINGDASLAFAADSVKTECTPDFAAVEGEVEFLVSHDGFTALYVKTEGSDKPIVIKSRNTQVCAGEKITLYFDTASAQIYRDGCRVTAKHPVTDNTAVAALKIKGGTVAATVGKNRFVFENTAGLSGSVCKSFRIPPSAVRKAAKGDKNTVKATVRDFDFLGDKTLLYLALDGFQPYFTAALDGFADVKAGEKITLTVDTGKLCFVPVGALSDYICKASESAPPYVFVSEDK